MREKYSNINLNENPSSGIRLVPGRRREGRTDERTEGQTDLTKLIVTFHNFANAPKRSKFLYS
jgi:hypothetical protein